MYRSQFEIICDIQVVTHNNSIDAYDNMDYTTNITIFRDDFTKPILHDDEWYMMLWGYYCKCCATIAAFIMEALRSIWTIEFATVIRDATTKLNDLDVDMFFAFILIYGCIIFGLVWIVHFIVGLLGSTENKDATENTKDPTENTKDPIENEDATEIEDPINNTEADDLPPPLVPEPTGPRSAIKQLRDIRSLLKELESKVKELESSIAEESLTSSANSTTDDSTTDDSTSNEETDEHNEQIDDREPPTMAQAKTNARLWQRNQVAKMKRQRRQQRQETEGDSDRTL